MSEYTPDRWVILKITPSNGEVFYKVFGTWIGGYLDGDSWRFNSGITRVNKTEDGYYEFFGSSGSVYRCHENYKGMSNYTAGVADNLCLRTEESGKGKIEILTPEELESYLESIL